MCTQLSDRYFTKWGATSWIEYEKIDSDPQYYEPFNSLTDKDKNFILKLPQLKYGRFGIEVLLLQSLLYVEYQPSIRTGIFDSKTESAVVAFQKKKNLEVDGICGKNTWTALLM